MLLYIHGFNSSAQSYKARVLRERLAVRRREDELAAPDLPYGPRDAIAVLERVIARTGAKATTLVGSSLGGYYATWLAETHGMDAVLVNPAVRPYELLQAYVGPQTNIYTGERYEVTAQHLAELRSLECDKVTPERYYLIVTTGDEVLDYRKATAKYAGCRQLVIGGADHGFSDFSRYVDVVLGFGGVSDRP